MKRSAKLSSCFEQKQLMLCSLMTWQFNDIPVPNVTLSFIQGLLLIKKPDFRLQPQRQAP